MIIGKLKYLPLKGQISGIEPFRKTAISVRSRVDTIESQPNEEFYWEAVRGNVDFYEGGHQWGGKGRIGAAASCAWRARTSTWEGIAWRKEERLVSEDALRISG